MHCYLASIFSRSSAFGQSLLLKAIDYGGKVGIALQNFLPQFSRGERAEVIECLENAKLADRQIVIFEMNMK